MQGDVASVIVSIAVAFTGQTTMLMYKIAKLEERLKEMDKRIELLEKKIFLKNNCSI